MERAFGEGRADSTSYALGKMRIHKIFGHLIDLDHVTAVLPVFENADQWYLMTMGGKITITLPNEDHADLVKARDACAMKWAKG